MKIGNREFNMENNNVYIMGILNVTPDSFSDGNKHNTVDKALIRVDEMIKEGADIIDIGGESTRPGHIPISVEEEIERILPIVEKIKGRFDIPISVDTYKWQVALESYKMGADMVNDIWGLLYDREEVNLMAKYTKEYNKVICLMHNDNYTIDNNMDNVINRLEISINEALKHGIDRDKIIIDPGIGFAKNHKINLYVMNNLDRICNMGYPVLLGTSRKSIIGKALDVEVDERLEGTIATTVYGMEKGIKFVRVHDIQANKRAIQMIKAIKDGGNYGYY